MNVKEFKTDSLLNHVQSQANHVEVLETLTICGLVTADQAHALTGLSRKVIRIVLDDLTQSTRRIPPALRVIPVKLSSTAGRPLNAYLPTPQGADILRSLFQDAPMRAYQVHDPIDVTALCCMMEVYTAARKQDLLACVEKKLPYGSDLANVRTDVLVMPNTGKPDSVAMLFEIEQQLTRNNLPRVIEKLMHLRGLFSSDQGSAYSSDVRVLFKLPAEDGGDTLRAWKDALASVMQQVGELPFALYWKSFSDFLDAPEWDGVSTFQHLEPSVLPAPQETAPDDEIRQPDEPDLDLNLNTLFHPPAVDLGEMNIVLHALDTVYREQFAALSATEDPRRRSQHFFSLMSLIYSASHYPGSDTLEYAALPYRSLMLLQRYLHAHQNKALLEQLRQAMPGLRQQASAGIIGFRNALTKLIWDIFLRYHGFSRGGALRVVIQVPDFQDRRSEFYTQVRIANDLMVDLDHLQSTRQRMRETEQALAWVVESLYHYADVLGLSDKASFWSSSAPKTSAGKNREVEDVPPNNG